LVGTDTIDLYKGSRSEVRDWGVRYVDIDILQWGSEEESLKVLRPALQTYCVKKMVAALEKKKSKTVAQNTPQAHSGFKLATGDEQTRAIGSATWRVAFDLPLITLHFPANENLRRWRRGLHRERLLRALAE
jgi:hypothetical protein